MVDAVAFLVILFWPIIPLWWIPVHGANKVVRKIGLLMYPIIGVSWILIAYPIYVNRELLLEYRVDFTIPIRVLGMLCVCAGLFLQVWTLKVLNIKTITGIPEIFERVKARMTIQGPFLYVRHPTYVSHTIFLLGIFLSTGILATGCVALIDFFIVNLIIIPLEEGELLQRFGDEYRSYMKSVPRYIPRLVR